MFFISWNRNLFVLNKVLKKCGIMKIIDLAYSLAVTRIVVDPFFYGVD
jgi:hypothetical protein